MKNIIILGEEYWFNKPDTPFTEATYLLKSLEYHRDKKKYNYVIIQKPIDFIDTINKIGLDTVVAIFLFQDVLSDSYLNKKTIFEMKKYMLDLSSKVYVYPPVEVTDIFSSKKYNLTLSKELPWGGLPHTEVYYSQNYQEKDENKIFSSLYKIVEKLWKTFKIVVVKKGYSYEGKQVLRFNKEMIHDFYEFKYKAQKLNFKNFWGVKTSSKIIDKGITRYYIIQGFNSIVVKRENEYRVFFHNGKPKFIATDDIIPNTCIKDEKKKPLEKEVIKFAKKIFKSYMQLVWKLPRLPILFRVDVSYAVGPEFQDKYSINVDGFENPIRLYANELEIDPSNFFYNPFECVSDANFSSKEIQKNMAKYITKYIRELK
jgi:hypothetical protein